MKVLCFSTFFLRVENLLKSLMTAIKKVLGKRGLVCGQPAEPGIFLATEIFKWEKFRSKNKSVMNTLLFV